MITIDEVKKIVTLIKRANCTSYALVSETAKELGVKKTVLMQYIEDNPSLFSLVKVEKGKKNYGLAIRTCYNTPIENPDSDEWLEMMQEKWKKKLHVMKMDYYGVVEFHFFGIDSGGSLREHLWRNTKEKIDYLSENGIIELTETGYGGFGDYHKGKWYLVNEKGLQSLKENGWTTDFAEVVNELKI